MTRVGVTGATGAMGREVLATVEEREDVESAFAVSRDPDAARADLDDDLLVGDEGALPDLLAEHDPDALVDFTVPSASVGYAAAAAEAGVPAVVGTTGFSEAERERLETAADRTPVLVAANFSRGVHALAGAIEAAAGTLPNYDAELTETHHNRKRDAPSGTARTLLDRLDDARASEGERVYGREGEQPREPGEVGVHVRRAGGVHGEHELLLAGNDEVLTLTHRAESRGVFAAGALDAAAWLAGRDPGWYDFEEVLE